ncbi:MAG: ABC transporter permease subunit [Paracoccus sp. (in: a-proteobacteria)]|uniref:ABC transporter permease n=1 Tax=Paracoccus sp. TaxID=267 RepID=UPI0039E52901
MDQLKLLAWGDTGWGDELARGFLMTLVVSAVAYLMSMGFGLLGASGKLSRNRYLRLAADIYTTVVRSLPELLMILLVYFSVAGVAERGLKALGLVGRDFEFSAFWAAVFALAFVSGAFMTEVLRAAIQAVPKGQVEAATAIGMPQRRIFCRIVFPQMIRHAVPGLGNLWLGMTKESSLVAVLGTFSELLYTGYRAAGATKQYGFFYMVIALFFLFISLVSMLAISRIEKRVERGYR